MRGEGVGAGRRIDAQLPPFAAYVVASVVGLLSFGPLEVAHQHSAHAQIEKQPGQYEGGASPTVLGEQELGEGCEHERANTAAAHRQAGGERPLAVEVVGDDHYSGHVAQRQAEAGDNTER